MRRLLAWIVTLVIGSLVLALSVLFAVMKTPTEPESPEDATSSAARPIPHSIESRKDCTRCHLPGSIVPFPADHIGLTEDVCTECHREP